MSLAERTASERFIQAMGPMLEDENKIQRVILFIQSMRDMETEFPQMSYKELEECIPLETAFNDLRNNVKKSYELL